MKEYGSNVQKLVEHIVTIPDKETRTKHAHILVELMRQIHPQMRDGADYSKKLWDDLYIMANFDLDVDSPFPAPPKEILGKKPKQIPYTQSKLKHKFYGRNLELLVLKAMMAETFEERKAFCVLPGEIDEVVLFELEQRLRRDECMYEPNLRAFGRKT